METLNDYGAVKYYGIRTLTTAIFQSWGGLYDLSSALRIGGLLVGLVALLLMRWLLGLTPIAAARTPVGVAALMLTGAIGATTKLASLTLDGSATLNAGSIATTANTAPAMKVPSWPRRSHKAPAITLASNSATPASR